MAAVAAASRKGRILMSGYILTCAGKLYCIDKLQSDVSIQLMCESTLPYIVLASKVHIKGDISS